VTDDAGVAPLHVLVMGEVVAIEVPDQATRDRLARQWSRAVVASYDGAPAANVRAERGDPDTEAALDYGLTSRVTVAALRATAGRRVNLHAGGVADDRRRVLAVVAGSGTGKTTATLALAHRLGYVSDETVSIDPDGSVAPHPKPLSVIVDPDRRHHKEQLSPDDLGLLATPDEGRLARLVVLHRGGNGVRGLSRLRTADGMLQLIEQSSSLAQLPRPLRTLHALLEQCGGVWALTYDEITDHLDELVALLADVRNGYEPPPSLRWHDGEDEPRLELEPTGPLLTRLPWVEAVEVGDELIVLTQSKATLLADLTATVWLQLSRPCSLDELVRAAERRHGPHERAEEIVLAAVATLEQEQLVSRGSLA
jgi:hypothetical protein